MDDTSAEADLAEHAARAHDAAGVDVSQVDAMLALTPRERLRMLFETASSLARLMPADADADPVV